MFKTEPKNTNIRESKEPTHTTALPDEEKLKLLASTKLKSQKKKIRFLEEEESIGETIRRRSLAWKSQRSSMINELMSIKDNLRGQHFHKKNVSRKRREICGKVENMKKQIQMMKRQLSLTNADIELKKQQIFEKNKINSKKLNHDLRLKKWKNETEKNRKMQNSLNKKKSLLSKKRISETRNDVLNLKKKFVEEKKNLMENLKKSKGNMITVTLKRNKEMAKKIKKMKQESKMKRLEHIGSLYENLSQRLKSEIIDEEEKIKTEREIAKKYLKEELELENELKRAKSDRKMIKEDWKKKGNFIKRREHTLFDKDFRPMRRSPEKMDVFLDYGDLDMSDDSFERKEKMRLKEFKFRISKKRCKTILPTHMKFS